MTLTDLRASSRKELVARAKRHQINGWHEMTKEELIQTLFRRLRSRKAKSGSSNGNSKPPASPGRRAKRSAEAGRSNGAAGNGRPPGTNGHSARRNDTSKHNGDKTRAATIAGAVRRLLKPTLIQPSEGSAAVKDRLFGRPHDAYWIHVQWTLTRRIIERAAAALGAEWHRALPVLRLFDVTASDTATCSKIWVRDIEIHGEIDHWYVPVDNPPRAYRLHIGYRTPRGRFFAMAQSNRVGMPRAGTARDGNGSGSNGETEHPDGRDNGAPHKFHDLRTAYLSRSLDADGVPVLGGPKFPADFPFELETELIVHGSTHPEAEITLLGDRVPVRKDGTFSLRFSLPNGRQVIPAVAVLPRGAEQRTIVLGIERNTKELERQSLDETTH